jgi:hypothetical protein
MRKEKIVELGSTGCAIWKVNKIGCINSQKDICFDPPIVIMKGQQ